MLIGLDGGATSAKAWSVERDPDGLRSGPVCARGEYPEDPSFLPMPLELQLAERAAPRVTEQERRRASQIAAVLAECVRGAAAGAGEQRVVLGICMPGLKTADRRGIAVLRHGPRAPELASDLEWRLAALGIELERPIRALLSDGDAAGLGEEYAARGAFRGVRTAYWIGGGTGIAEALKIDGELVPMDAASNSLGKAWQVESELFRGATAEDLIAPGRIAARWAAAGGLGMPEDAAEAGDERARELSRQAGRALAELVQQRARALAARGATLERCVIGARLALIWRSPVGRWIREPACDELDARLGSGSALRLFVRSELEQAAAIGAASAALGE